jgi:hypothetical protein
MKYICMGYYEPAKLAAMTEDERNAMFDECFEYDDYLRANGHSTGGEALQPPENALTLYWKKRQSASRRSTRELPEAVWQVDTSSGSFDLRSSRFLRDSRGAQDDRVGNFGRTEDTAGAKMSFFAIASPLGMRYSFASPQGQEVPSGPCIKTTAGLIFYN